MFSGDPGEERYGTGRGAFEIEMLTQARSSCPDSIQASVELRESIFEESWMAGSSPAMTTERVLAATPLLLRPIRRQKHPRGAGDHVLDALGRGGGCGLKDERLEQRGLAHLHELRRCEMETGDRDIAQTRACFEIGGKPPDRHRDDIVVEALADIRHP